MPRYPPGVQFDEVLRTFAAFFERESIRYAVAGGLALQAWGSPRVTHDVDFLVDGARRTDAMTFAESLGYETTYASEGYSNHEHRSAALGHVDLIYVYGSTAETMFAGAIRRKAVGVELPTTRPEHLVAMKVRAMKSAPMRVLIDAPDIGFLMTLPMIDHDVVREYFSQHGLLKIYDELQKNGRR